MGVEFIKSKSHRNQSNSHQSLIALLCLAFYVCILFSLLLHELVIEISKEMHIEFIKDTIYLPCTRLASSQNQNKSTNASISISAFYAVQQLQRIEYLRCNARLMFTFWGQRRHEESTDLGTKLQDFRLSPVFFSVCFDFIFVCACFAVFFFFSPLCTQQQLRLVWCMQMNLRWSMRFYYFSRFVCQLYTMHAFIHCMH